jgi:hypothetical protein
VSIPAAHVATKMLKLKPYRTVVYQLLPPDAEQAIDYSR